PNLLIRGRPALSLACSIGWSARGGAARPHSRGVAGAPGEAEMAPPTALEGQHMKVLLCSTLYHPNVVGGAEQSVRLFAESLAGVGHEVVVVTLSRERTRTRAEVDGVRVHYLPIRNLHWPFAEPGPGTARKA